MYVKFTPLQVGKRWFNWLNYTRETFLVFSSEHKEVIFIESIGWSCSFSNNSNAYGPRVVSNGILHSYGEEHVTEPVGMPRTIDKATCFVLLTKFAGRKYSYEEKFARLLEISSYKEELEGLYRKNSIRRRDQATLNVLFQILQVQEVGSIEQYHLNGLVFKVHVLEDTQLWHPKRQGIQLPT